MPPFKKLGSGSGISDMSAGDYNAMIDAARAHLEGGGGNAAEPVDWSKDQTTVLVQNNGADILDVGGVVGLDTILFTPTDNLQGFKSNPVFNGTTPAVPSNLGQFGITLAPITKGSTGRVVVSGLAVCKVSMVTSTDSYADIYDGASGYLQSFPYGAAQILYKESSGSTRWALVRIGNFGGSAICKPNSNIAKGASGTVTIWSGAAGSEAATSTTVTAYALGVAVTAGKFCSLDWINRIPYVGCWE